MNTDGQPKSQRSKKAPELGRAPSPFFYGLIHHGTALLCRLLVHPRIHRDPRLAGLPGPLIILGNHPSYLDPPLVAMAIRDRRINFLTTQVFFRSKKIGAVLFKVGAIPKVQFRTDSRALKAMLHVLARRGALAIFPEGQRSIDGSMSPFDDAIAKLIRKTRCAVAIVHTDGGYLTWPRWSTSSFRRGHVDIRTELLLTGEESARTPVEEIQRRIVEALYYQDYEWQKQSQVRFQSKKPAEGLDRILHQCPACHRELAMRSTGEKLFCRYCGNTALMDSFGFLHPAPPDQVVFPDARTWHLWQIDQQRAVVQTDGFQADYMVTLATADGEQDYIPYGTGCLNLSETGFSYKGLFQDQPVVRQFPLPGRGGLNADYGLRIELASTDVSYCFTPEDGQMVIRIVDQVTALLDKKQPDQR